MLLRSLNQQEPVAMPRKLDLSGLTTIGIDPGKNSLLLIGLDAKGAIVLKEKVARSGAVTRLANVAPCLIGIEAGMGTHYLARQFSALGHDVRQVPAFFKRIRMTSAVPLLWPKLCSAPQHAMFQ
jgi:hypothetical protein